MVSTLSFEKEGATEKGLILGEMLKFLQLKKLSLLAQSLWGRKPA